MASLTEPSRPSGPTKRLSSLAREIYNTPGRTGLILLAAGLFIVIVLTAVMQVKLNAWNQPFYDAIERRNWDEFLHQLGIFFLLAAGLLVLNVAQTGANQLIRVRLRDLATRDLISNWMTERRATRISRAGEIGVNPDQRIQSDAQTLTEYTTDLGIGLLQSTILLLSFIGVLWVLSKDVVIPIGGQDLAIPGYMVWAALLYAASGSFISWRIGRPLVRLGTDRYAHEAEFRAAVVQASQRAEGIALNNGEAGSRRVLFASLETLVVVLRQIAFARARLTWVTASYGWVGLVFPIIVAAPGYFAGRLTFGELMMVVGAFNQVQSSLRWFVDNTGTIADWRATLVRVMSFREALLGLDAVETVDGVIAREESADDRLVLDGVNVCTRHGTVALSDDLVEVSPGERVLLLGQPGSGRTSFFLAIAGLWGHGSGRIVIPPEAEIAYLTQRPFLPAGTLRDALAQAGAGSGATDDEGLRSALSRVGLDRLADALDRAGRWDLELATSDQERLGYARLILAKPRWLVSDEGLDPTDDPNRALILSILSKELAETAIVNISQRREPTGFYTRVVELVASDPGDRVVNGCAAQMN
jgi:putative ATP-binding cassette transporter